MTAYISGHLKINTLEFLEHYVSKINEALRNNHKFVVGDAEGVDTIAQKYLYDLFDNSQIDVTVFHMFTKPRNNAGNFKTVGGFTTNEDRDAAMTAASDYDIAWVRPGKEKSGTAKNLKRRKTLKVTN